MARYYVDTNVWLDFLESRSSFLKPFGEFAFQFLKKCVDGGHVVLYSDLVLDELSIRYRLEEVERLCFTLLREVDLLQHVTILDREIHEACEVARNRHIPWGDAMHAVLARDNNAVVVTRDRHFRELTDIAESITPEEVF